MASLRNFPISTYRVEWQEHSISGLIIIGQDKEANTNVFMRTKGKHAGKSFTLSKDFDVFVEPYEYCRDRKT